MANYRLVLGKLARMDTTPWANTKVFFQLVTGSYTHDTQFPKDKVTAYTDNTGVLYTVYNGITINGVQLWCNEEGGKSTRYRCTLPGAESFEFNLPVGDGSDIQISILREASTTPAPPTDTVLTYIDEQLAGVTNPTRIFTKEYEAASNISALRVVGVNSDSKLAPVDIDNFTFPIVGLTLVAINQGENYAPLLAGEATDNNWNWSANSPLFLTSVGELTQVADLNKDNLIKVGFAITPTTIHFRQPSHIKIQN